VTQCNSITSYGCNVETQVAQRNIYRYGLAQGCGKSSVINMLHSGIMHAQVGFRLIIAYRKQQKKKKDNMMIIMTQQGICPNDVTPKQLRDL
jgi:predicted GTPase